jgi:DNA-binding transcriptional regulator YhcF (GntR family)
MNYELKIVDTSDAYILAFLGNGLNKDKMLPTYEALYNEIGVSINIIDTPYSMLSEDTMHFIINTCGAVVPTTLPFFTKPDAITKDGNSLLDKLTKDIETVIDFNRIKKFWQAYTHPCTINTRTDCAGVVSSIVDTCDNSFTTIPQASSSLSYIFDIKLLPDNHVAKSSRAHETVTYILWNTTYSIAIIYEDLHDVIPHIHKNNGEWEIVHILSPMSEDFIATCKCVFHKKTFDNVNALGKKVDGLKQLLGINENVNNPSIDSAMNKKMLIDYIEEHFEISKDSTNKIRASDLYKRLCNNFRIDYTNESTFKRKLIGHLLELGIVKKRFSDGYYFCGINAKS